MADAAANAYLRISKALASQDREVVEKVVCLIWIRMATLPEPLGVHGLSEDDLILLFREITTSFDNKTLSDLELAAEESDGLPVGDFWAACVYISALILDGDSDFVGYLIDRYISFLEKIFPNDSEKIDYEVGLVMNSIFDISSVSTFRNENLLEYVRRLLKRLG